METNIGGYHRVRWARGVLIPSPCVTDFRTLILWSQDPVPFFVRFSYIPFPYGINILVATLFIFRERATHGYLNHTRVLLQRRHELIIWKGEAVIRWIVKLYQGGKDPNHNIGIEQRQKFSILLLESLGVDHQFSELSQFLDLGSLEGVFPSSLSSIIHGIDP